MRPIFVLAVLTLLFAGCFSPEGKPVEGASVDAGADAGASSAAAADAKAPSASADAAASSETAADAELVPREFPVSIEGRTGTNACIPMGPGSCGGAPVPIPSGSENVFNELEYAGTPSAIELTLTWEAATPASNEMMISVFAARACGDGCIEWDDTMFQAHAMGASPLALAAEGIVLNAGETLYMHVSVDEPNPSTGPVFFAYSVEQAFAVEGVVTALVPQA